MPVSREEFENIMEPFIQEILSYLYEDGRYYVVHRDAETGIVPIYLYVRYRTHAPGCPELERNISIGFAPSYFLRVLAIYVSSKHTERYETMKMFLEKSITESVAELEEKYSTIDDEDYINGRVLKKQLIKELADHVKELFWRSAQNDWDMCSFPEPKHIEILDVELGRGCSNPTIEGIISHFLLDVIYRGDFIGDKELIDMFFTYTPKKKKIIERLSRVYDDHLSEILANFRTFLTTSYLPEIANRYLRKGQFPKFPSVTQVANEFGFYRKTIKTVYEEVVKDLSQRYMDYAVRRLYEMAYSYLFRHPYVTYHEFKSYAKRLGYPDSVIRNVWKQLKPLVDNIKLKNWLREVARVVRKHFARKIESGEVPTKKEIMELLERKGLRVYPKKKTSKLLDYVFQTTGQPDVRVVKRLVRQDLINKLIREMDSIVKTALRKKQPVPSVNEMAKLMKEQFPDLGVNTIRENYILLLQSVYGVSNPTELNNTIHTMKVEQLAKKYVRKYYRRKKKMPSINEVIRYLRKKGVSYTYQKLRRLVRSIIEAGV
jgi:DNA-binding transcriptional regulator YhcF (GntR family)